MTYYGEKCDAQADKANYNQTAQMQMRPPGLGDRPMPELESLLSTIREQALGIRVSLSQIIARTFPQPEESCSEKQCFGGGYVGQAEEIRSIQREIANMLSELSKYA